MVFEMKPQAPKLWEEPKSSNHVHVKEWAGEVYTIYLQNKRSYYSMHV